MKTAGLFLLFLLCTLAELACKAMLLICGYLKKYASYRTQELGKTKRRICAEHLLMKRKKAGYAPAVGNEVPRKEHSPAAETGVVGASKTVFITELPVLRSRQEIKPFKSEHLVMTPQGDFEEEEPGGYDTDTAPVGEDELGGFDPDGDEEAYAIHSSGVSFEELSETAGVLAEEESSTAKKQKAAGVLTSVNGTELFNFIAMNEVYTEKAKALMTAFREQTENDGLEVFNVGKYME